MIFSSARDGTIDEPLPYDGSPPEIQNIRRDPFRDVTQHVEQTVIVGLERPRWAS